MQHHARWRTIWFCPLPGCPVSSPNKENLVKHLQSKQHAKGMDVIRTRALAKEIVQQNCYWPVSQTFADKLLRTSKRLIWYVALYSIADVAMEGRMFRIPSSSMDIGFIDACAAHLTPKMSLSQVLPSGANLRRVAIDPRPTRSTTQRPCTSTYRDDENVAEASALKMDLVAPLFQPLRGETGRTWFTSEYGIAPDTSSLMSSESATEREDSDEEILSFDLGPEPFDPYVQERLPSDEWLDDLQQGLIPPGAEPKIMEYDPETHEMPDMPSLIDTMRQDVAKGWNLDSRTYGSRTCDDPNDRVFVQRMNRRMNRLLYRELEKRPHIPAHTQIHLSYARALVQPCSLHDRAPRRSHRFRLQWRDQPPVIFR